MADKTPSLVRMIDLPGFADIEATLVRYARPRAVLPSAVEAAIDEVSRKTFRITGDDAPDGLKVEGLTDDEIVEFMKPLGMDFTDKRGFPLRCAARFARQAEAAAKGLAGKMPEAPSEGLETWAAKLQKDAAAFRKDRR